MPHVDIASILELSVPERILLVEDIWDSVAAAPESVELTDAQRQELDRRLSEHIKSPRAGAPWEEVKNRIRAAQ